MRVRSKWQSCRYAIEFLADGADVDIDASLHEVLDQSGERFADRFYRLLFNRYPELERFFCDVNMQHQAAMVTMALQVMVQYERRATRSANDYLRVLGERHALRGIKEDAFAKFEDALVTALAEFHGEDWTLDLANQWHAAFGKAVGVMLESA